MVVWSAKGSKTTPGVAADEVVIIDSEDAVAATKNKRMGYQNLADSLLDLSSVSSLTDGQTTILSTSLVAFEQGGSKFKASFVPNASTNLNISNQTQLEAELGTDLEIPDGDNVTITILDSFTLTKPFKIGLGSSLRIHGTTINVSITYTGASAMFQNTNPANLINILDITDILLIGDGTNSVFDLVGGLVLILDSMQFQGFDSLGTVEVPGNVISNVAIFDVDIGFVFINPANIIVDSVTLSNFAPLGITLFSVISNIAGSITFTNVLGPGTFAGDSLFFLDPNAPETLTYIITRSPSLTLGDFYQQGTIIAINSVADNGSGDTRFTTAASHGLRVGQVVVISDFATETTYNGTFIVTAVDTPITGTTFDAEIVFIATDTGNMNKASFDSTDVSVLSIGNQGEADSMFIAESGFEDAGAGVTTINTVDVPEVIVNANFAFANLERFGEGTSNQGQVIALDPSTRRYAVSYSGSLMKTGGSAIMGVVLLKNGSLVGFNPPRSPSSTSAQVGGVNIIELTENDTLQVGIINYTNDDDITATHVDLVINRA